MAATRSDRGKLPGTQSAGSAEGAVADGQMSIEVVVLLTGSPSQVNSDYSTLATNVSALTSGKTINWKKR